MLNCESDNFSTTYLSSNQYLFDTIWVSIMRIHTFFNTIMLWVLGVMFVFITIWVFIQCKNPIFVCLFDWSV